MANVAHAGANLVEGDAEAGKQKVTTCAACHGANGISQNPQWPSLAGQHSRYSYQQLQWFKEGKRNNVLMNSQAMALSDEDMRDLAAYFESQDAAQREVANPDTLTRGEGLYRASSLRNYASGGNERSNTEAQKMMTTIAQKLTPEEIDALASYIQGLN